MLYYIYIYIGVCIAVAEIRRAERGVSAPSIYSYYHYYD